ncbi:spore-associated protein A [Kitasatospora sp. NPDC004615]|uniref:spore-associated protein A n=1 Tax=Kitasatospora sp. NPDC004615 TaxID=3364017 RepID=UPI00367D3B0E
MLKNVKRLVTGAAVLATASAGLMIAPSVAQAATYNGACGSGYSVIGILPVTGGTVFLTYNGSTNCVVTVRNSPGSAVYMGAWIERSDGSGYQGDFGNYTTYAGPVYVYAPGSCIDWGGNIGGSYASQSNSHCG